MDTNALEKIIIQDIRKRVFDVYMDLENKINQEIKESEERENQSIDEVTKEFHRGVHIGMTHVLIMITKLKF